MNEDAINDGYEYFVQTGYPGTIDDYKTLLNTNGDAVNDTYKYFVQTGYKGTVNDFVTLMGIGEKKNPVGTGTGEEEVMVSESTQVVEEPGSSEPSLQPSNEEVDSALATPVDTNNLIEPEVLSSEDNQFDFSNNNTELDFFERSLEEQVTKDLTRKTEESAVPIMNYHFNDYGFTFTEEDYTGDEMKVTAANGNTLDVELESVFGMGQGYADELKQFLRENKDESAKLHQLQKGYVQKEAKIQNKKEAQQEVKKFDAETNLVRDEINEYLAAKSFYDSQNMSEMDPDEVVYVEGPDGSQMATTPRLLAEKIALSSQNIQSSKNNLAIKGKELDDVIGGWYGMRSEQKSPLGFSYNAFLDGSARIASNYANKLFDLGTYAQGPVGSGLMSKDDYRTRVLTKGREAGALGKTYTDERIQEIIKDDEAYNQLEEIISKRKGTTTKSSSRSTGLQGVGTATTSSTTTLLEDIESKILDELRKKVKYDVDPGEVQYANPFSQYANDPSLDDKKGLLEATRGGLRDVIGMSETTVEATKEAKKGFWGGALLGLTESIPAMLGPAPIRIINMISQVEDHVNEEMANDRSFDDISEVEKAVFTLPLGIVVGVLENLGFRNAIAQKGLASKILLRVLKKSGKNITGQNFRQVVKKEVNSMMSQGLLLVSASGLAEFETGLAQEIADIGFKQAYNAIKEKDMFTTPESWADGFKQVIRAGAQEAVGGFVIGTPSAIVQTATAGDFTGLGNGVFEMYEDIRNEPIVRSAFIQKIKQSILEGTKTKKEGDREIAMYDQVNGIMDQIPGDLPTNQKKELLGNLLRQQELQDDIDKYNKLLTKKQQQELLDLENDVERIVRSGNTQNQQEAQETELNTQAIKELKEEGVENPTPEQIKTKRDAIQESSPESVDVQESTTDSQEVGNGNTQGAPTQKNIENETNPDQTTQEEVDDLTSIVNEQTGRQEQSEQEQEGTPEQPTRRAVVENEQDGTIDVIVSDGKNIVVPGVSVSNNVHVSESSEPGIKGKLQGLTNSLLKQAKNAGISMAKLIPDLDIVIHADENNYNRSVNKGNQGTRGNFNLATNTIHINATKANTRTVAHEVMHAVLLKKLGIDSKKYSAVTGRMLQAVIKGLPKDSNLKEVIEDFAKGYAVEEQNEEKVSELFGYLSAAYTQLDGPTKNIVKRWLQKVAKAVGLPVNITEFTKEEADMIEFFNTVSKKVREGTEVTEGDIEVIPGEVVEDAEGPVPENIPDDGPSIDLEATEKNQKDRGGIDFKKIKRGSINDLSGVNAFVFAADQATYGNIESPSGTKFMFNGGYLYPYGSQSQGSNAAWVFADETAANKVLNKAKQSDGVGLVMSQVPTGVTGNLQFYDFVNAEIANAVEKGASPKELISYINEKLKLTKVAKGLKAKGLPSQISSLEELQTLMVPLNFEQRGSFTKTFLSKDSYDQFGISPFAPLKTVPTNLQDVVNDPSLKKVKYGDIVSAIQFEQDGKPFKLNEGDPGYHPAYPWALPGKPMMVFNNGVDVRKVYPNAKPKGLKTNQTPLGQRKREQAARSAMGGQYVAKVPKDINVEGAPIQIQEKAQKVTFKIEKQRVYKDNASGVTFLTKGYGGTFINIPRKAITIKDTDGLSQSQKPLVEVTMDRDTYNRQDQARKVVDGKESFVNELETIRGFETVSLNEKAQVITEQDLEILYPEKSQKDNITEAQVQKALQTDKTAQRIIAKGIDPKQGENVGIRLNLNVFKNTGVPVQSIHKGNKTDAFKKVDGTSGNFRGEVINYAPAVTLKDVYLNTNQKSIYEVKNKIKNKFPLASVDGKFQDVPFDKQDLTGTELRFNPFNTQLFETLDGKPVRFIEEATVSGTRVFARGKIEYFTEANKPKPYTSTSEKAQLSDGYFVQETGKGEFTLMKENRRAGEMSIAELRSDKPSVSQVYLRPTDKGLGLAPDMYREIAKILEGRGKTLVSSKYTNDASQGVWKRLVKDGDAIVIGGRIDAKGKFRPQYSMRTESTEKAQKAGVDRLTKMYEMNNNGVIFNKPGVNRAALEDWANSLGFTVEIKRGDIGELTGFKLIKPDGKVYRPTKEKAQKSVDEKAQKTFNKFDTPLQIINKARGLNFTDPAILDYLTRVRKFTKTEVRDLMKVNADLLNIIPPSMGNIVGGMKAGIKLFNKVSNHYNKLIKKNAKAKTKLSEQEIMDQAMDFLRAQPEYKKMADAVLKGISTEQMVLEMDVARALGGKQSTNLNSAIRNARVILRAKTKGQKQLRKIQRELRNFMRKTLPVDIYSKSEAINLMRKIEQANNGNIQQIMNEVMEFAATKNNVRLDKSITDLLDPKNTVKRISNILKGVKIDENTRKRLASIKKRIDTGNMKTIDKVLDYISKLETEYETINLKPIKTEADYTAMADLNIIMNMVNSNNLMSNEDITKVNVLAGVETELKQIITAGRTLLKEQLRKAHVEYRRQFMQVYQDITGRKESFEDQARRELKEDGIDNPTEADIFDKITDIIEVLKDTKKTRTREVESKKKEVKSRFKKLTNVIVTALGNVMAKNSDLFLLMDKISLLPAELFEGITQEEITKKIDAANREMKGRMLMNDALIIFKFQELFGKKYKSIVTSFGRKTEAFNLPDGTEMVLSPNQMYYLYNQHKDLANHPGLEKTFSTDSKGLTEVMNEITTRLESEQYKDLKEFADWQVDVLFPSLYNHYNKAYQDTYRTQMPYNVNYAGMVYRDGQEAEGVDLLAGGKSQYHNVVAANSTKMREQNSKSIRAMDGTNVLYTYMRDMEYFSAYTRPINDINKLFTNDLIKSEIENLHGKTTMTAINTAIEKIANKGSFKEQATMDNAVDIMQDMFILSRLGINPVVTLKQLTSFVTYASDIGYVNWMKNAALSRFGKGQDVKAIWKEIAANSTYLQDRDAKSMTKAIEMYSDDAMESVFPDIKIGGQRIMTGANKESLVSILMYTTKVGDRGAIFLGGVPNYVYYKNKALEAGKTEQEAIDIAIIKFERDTKRSQQSTDLQDRDYYQTKGPIFRALNMFLTTPKQYLRKEVYAIRNMYRLASSGGKSGKGNKMDAGRIFLTYHVVMPMFFQFVANGMPGLLADWDDEDKKDLLSAAILGNINALFIYGEFAVKIKDLLSGKPESFLQPKTLPILTQGTETLKKFNRYMRLKDPKKKQEALYAALAEMSQFSGLPINNVRKIFKNMEELIEGGEDPAKVILRLFNYSEYQIQSESERKSSKKSKKKAIKKVKEKVQDNSIFKDTKKNDNAIFKTGTKNDNRIFK
jgi:hypothetical protein